ncbi:hypothetical protein M3Y95_00795200 [Aphelenchoides besseyi]|nr:hypothetical protein M3Y95_00795200 [Aphelenchoides besseyi]
MNQQSVTSSNDPAEILFQQSLLIQQLQNDVIQIKKDLVEMKQLNENITDYILEMKRMIAEARPSTRKRLFLHQLLLSSYLGTTSTAFGLHSNDP